MYPELKSYIEESLQMFAAIPSDRTTELERLAAFVDRELQASREAKLTFICTHNSRRSQMAQIWAQTAAAWHGVDGIATFSGGTGATAFNPRAVAALQRAGFRIERTSEAENPVYQVRFADDVPVMRVFSKVLNQEPNPSTDFCAVMTCSQADEACPIIFGASERFSLAYEDPKAYDGSERETEAYDKRCRQISVEMLHLFSRLNGGRSSR
jgi:hypothetical protein